MRHFFFCTIFIYFWFVPFFGSNFAFAEVQDYAHAIVTTSTGKKISVEVADTVEKRSLDWGNVLVWKMAGACCLSLKNEKRMVFG